MLLFTEINSYYSPIPETTRMDVKNLPKSLNPLLIIIKKKLVKNEP